MSLPSHPSRVNPPSAADLARMEAPLIALAQASGGDIGTLLTAFFSFLHRRTDFYVVRIDDEHIDKESNDKERNDSERNGNDKNTAKATTSPPMGFPPGHAEQLLLASFRQFPLRRLTPGTPTPSKDTPEPTTNKNSLSQTTTAESKSTNNTKTTNNHNPASDSQPPRHTPEGLQVPEGNGGRTDRYTWTQSVEECTVLLPLPHGTRAKDLQVNLRTKSIRIAGTHQPPASTLLQGDLAHEIYPDESTWTIESDVLLLVLTKKQKAFWDVVLLQDAENFRIDVDLVDSTRHVSSYDEATQAQIRKLIFDQSQLRQGKLPSDQLLQTISGRERIENIKLPPGVEYIDQMTLDEKMTQKSK